MPFHIISRSIILITVLFLVSSFNSLAQEDLANIDPDNIPQNVTPPDIEVENVELGLVTFFTEERLFDGLCGSLNFEDFEDTNNAPLDDVTNCGTSINSSTDNDCYSPGDLITGFTIDTIDVRNVLVFTPFVFNVTNVAVGPQFTTDNMQITFTEFVNAVGLDLVNALFSSTARVDVYGVGDVLLGSTVIDLTNVNGTFLGIIASEQITRIETVEFVNAGELLYDLSFGSCDPGVRNIPTLSEWGLIAMAGLIGFIGLLALRRRRAAA